MNPKNHLKSLQKHFLQILKSRNLQTGNLKNTKYPKPITLNTEKP